MKEQTPMYVKERSVSNQKGQKYITGISVWLNYNSMKYLIIVFIFITTFSASAQNVSLTNKEFITLNKLIKSDTVVAGLYSRIKKTADLSLNDTPNPIDTVVSEGHLSTDPKKIITGRSLRDIDKMYSLGIVYRIENKNVYLYNLG